MDKIKAILAALGIGEDDDAVTAIEALKAEHAQAEQAAADAVAALRAQAPEKGEVAELKAELKAVQQGFLTREADLQRRVIELERENAQAAAEAVVDRAISEGRVIPANRDMALKLALRDSKEFEEFARTLPGVDYSERGVAQGAELAALEPTATEIAIAKQLGTWDESDPAASRREIMQEKARARGTTLPED